MSPLSDELRTALESDDGEALSRLVERRRRRDFEALRELLSPDPSVPSHYRRKALVALGRWGDASVVPAIADVLPELTAQERFGAIDALGRLGTADATRAVAEYARDPSPQVRKAVVVALQRIDSKEARRTLTELQTQESEDWIRELASKKRRSR